MFFKKKKDAEKNYENRELVAQNSKLIEVLIVLAKNDDMKNQLEDIKEELKYLIPSPNDKVKNCDKKIKAQIEDIKIALTKENEEKAEKLLLELRVLIAERKAQI